jgi:hypothetical protein
MLLIAAAGVVLGMLREFPDATILSLLVMLLYAPPLVVIHLVFRLEATGRRQAVPRDRFVPRILLALAVLLGWVLATVLLLTLTGMMFTEGPLGPYGR